MAGFTTLSQWIQVATAVMAYALGLQITGLVTNSWCRTTLSHMGLFKPASYLSAPQRFKDPEDVCMVLSKNRPGWLYVVQVFICLGTIVSVVDTLVIFTYTCMSKLNGQRIILIYFIIGDFIIVTLNSIGCLVYILKLPDSQYYSWSYIEIVCASGLCVLTVIFTGMEIRKLD